MSDEEDVAFKRRYMRWTGELQEAYLEALERCGGLHEARPKTLLDMLQPRFPFLTLQNVKNHLQKQRTKEAKAGGGRRASVSHRSLEEEEDLDDADPMDSGEGPASAGGAGPAPPRGAPAIWLSDSWAGHLCDATGVAPNNLIDLAKRALALTLHQLALYRKLLGELEQYEEDHRLLVAALREDPSGQSIVLEAQRAGAAGGGAGMSSGVSGGSRGGAGSLLTGTTSGAGSGEDGRAVRLRRLLARLLPPNPFSSGPKAEAAMKLAAWMSAVSREGDGASVSAGSHLGGAGDAPPHGRRAAAPEGPVRAAAGRQGGAGAEEMEAEDEQPQRRSKRHKPLSELLAEIPLQEPLRAPAAAPAPGVPSMPGLAAAAAPQPPPAADQLQQLLLGTGAGLGSVGGGDPLGGALGLLLQQHLSGEHAQAAQEAMEMDDDALMLRALDAQMSSLLLQSVSNALLRSAQEGGDVPMQAIPGAAAGAAPTEAAAAATAPAAPGGFDAAATLAAAGQLQLPAHFQDAVVAALGDGPLSTSAVDVSALRSFLDMLSSAGMTALPSGQQQGGSGSGQVGAAGAAAAPAAHDPAHLPPLSVATFGGGSGSGSGGSGNMGGMFSAFKPTLSGSGGSGAAAAGGGMGSGGAKPDG